jgi:antitoxin FitA
MDALCFHYETMATLTIKNMPDELYATLTRKAKKNRRSINSEAIVRLEKALADRTAASESVTAKIRKDREAMLARGVWLTDETLEIAKNEGRP